MLFRFKLTYSGEDTTVIEPKGWSEFKSEIKRDFNSHGVIFKYTSGTLKLGFADGRDVLETAFQNDGFDAVVTLTADQREADTDAWVNAFTGNAVMKNREFDEDYFNCDFENSTFQQKVINRLKTKVKIDTLLDLDGNTLSGSITEQVHDWNTISLDRVFFAENPLLAANELEETVVSSGSFSNLQWCGFYFGDVKIDTLQEIVTKTTKIILNNIPSTSKTGFVDAIDIPVLWTATKSGNANISGQVNFDVSLLTEWISGAGDLTSEYDLFLLKRPGDGGADVQTSICTETNIDVGVSTPQTVDFNNQNCSFSIDVTVDVGDAFWIIVETHTEITTGVSDMTTTIRFSGTNFLEQDIKSNVNITQLQDVEVVEDVKSWLVHDVMERLLYIISGDQNILVSDFFGNTENGYSVDGCGALNVITNGYQLRTIVANELNISLNDVLASLHAIYGIGYGFEKQGDGTYKFRVETMEYFYADTEIMDLGSPVSIKEGGSYIETSNEELILNQVEIGYEKFNQDIGVNNIFEDFLTESTYSLPLETVEGTYTQKSKLIASNDIIQATYDERFVLTESWKYDEDNFIIKVVRSGSDIIPENDEFFESVGGLDDAASAYNIRHAPVYMFLNHALIVNSSLMGKSLSRLIQNTSAVINSSFNATFSSYEECLLGDSQRLQRSSAGNIEIGDNYAGLRLFNPINHRLTVALAATQFTTLIDSMEGDNLGYLSYRDNDGNTKQGYLLDAMWSPVEGIAEVTTLEKADNYGL